MKKESCASNCINLMCDLVCEVVRMPTKIILVREEKKQQKSTNKPVV